VGILVQRYGEATGGAEAHARAIAQRMAPHWDVTVLTTCATDHLTWENTLEPGPSREGPVKVLRFPAERTRDMRGFNRLSRGAFAHANDRLHEERWLGEQGPFSPALLEYLAKSRDDYDGFVAFTALYVSTAWGLPLLGDRALLVPTAHDEPPMRFDVYDDVFAAPQALLCNTPEEEAFIRARFPRAARSRVLGVGVDLERGDGGRFRERFGIQGPYLFYVGRIEPGKDLPQVLAYYAALRSAWGHDAPQFLLAGALHMQLSGEGVRHLGRITDEEKRDGLAGAAAAVAPSRYESLSLLTLEAFAQGTPVVANGHSEVLAGQCRRSGGGVTYADAPGFIAAVGDAIAHRSVLGERGRRFAARHSWSKVINVYREEMDQIVANNAAVHPERGRGASLQKRGST
jgi:glycosyltransferase involved in cell wall biosynthesis